MLMTYLLLSGAIVFEVTGTLALKASDGFSRLGSSLLVAACYVLAFVFLSLVLNRGLPVAVAYAVWSAAGIIAIAAIGALFLHERLSLVQMTGMAFVIVGCVTLQLGTKVVAQADETMPAPHQEATRVH